MCLPPFKFVLLLTCSAASGSRWVSSRGTVNWIFLGLPVSMVALSVKKGDGTKRRRRRRTDWSKQRQSVREKEGKRLNEWDYGDQKMGSSLQVRLFFYFFLSYLCFNTFFLDWEALRLILLSFFSPVSTCSCLYYLSTLLPLSDSQLPQRQGHSRRGTPLLHSHLLCLSPSHTSPSLLSHFFLSVLDDEDCSAAALAQMREDNKNPPPPPAPVSLFCCKSFMVTCAFIFQLSICSWKTDFPDSRSDTSFLYLMQFWICSLSLIIKANVSEPF